MDQDINKINIDAWEQEEEISLLDYLVVIVSNLKLIISITVIFTLVGLFIALTGSKTYTASAQVIREIPSEGGTSASLAALRGFGLNLGGGSTGLNPETFPDILKSREVCLTVSYEKYFFRDIDSVMSLIDYYNLKPGLVKSITGFIKKYTIGLPGTIISLFKKSPEILVPDIRTNNLRILTEDEENAIESVRDMVSVNIDQTSGIMSISVVTQDAFLSASIIKSFILHSTERVREIYTKKARENVQFIKDRFDETEVQLIHEEEVLAKFLDSNRSPQEARLQVEIDRLKRNVAFKSQLYQELQSQLTQAEIELQRTDPVLTVLDQPVPPLEKTGPKRKLILLLSIFLGGGFALGLVFIKEYIINLKKDDENKLKLEEISQKFYGFIQSHPFKTLFKKNK